MPAQDNSVATSVAVMASEMKQMKTDIHDIKTDMKGQYVTQAEIKILKAIVYGAASSILLGFMGAVTAFFIQGGLK